MADIPQPLREAYHARCNVDGASLEDLIEEVAPSYTADALLALVDEIEGKILESIALMVQERPEMEEAASMRALQTRARMDRVRSMVRERA